MEEGSPREIVLSLRASVGMGEENEPGMREVVISSACICEAVLLPEKVGVVSWHWKVWESEIS